MIANEIRRKHNPHFLDTVQEFVFGPGKSVLHRKTRKHIGGAKKSIYIMLYVFTKINVFI